ncbi:hypothetical protein Tco_0817382 [Tanacetum coccineum]
MRKPKVGEKYVDAAQLKECLTYYSLANRFSLWFYRTSNDSLIARCGRRPEKLKYIEKGKQKKQIKYPTLGANEGSNYPFRCYGRMMLTESSFQVISLNEEHTCVRDFNYAKTKALNEGENIIQEHYGSNCEAVENGFSECFNSVLVLVRNKPLITMLESMRVILMERLNTMRQIYEKWTRDICPNIQKRLELNKDKRRFWHVNPAGGNLFEVRNGSEAFRVDEHNRTCTCRMWKLSAGVESRDKCVIEDCIQPRDTSSYILQTWVNLLVSDVREQHCETTARGTSGSMSTARGRGRGRGRQTLGVKNGRLERSERIMKKRLSSSIDGSGSSNTNPQA